MNDKLPLIEITRFLKNRVGTWGILGCGGFSCFTVELPDKGNAPYHSCIPAGLYLASRGTYSKGNPPYPDLELQDVPGRTFIEIHAANEPDELLGCIAVVESLRSSAGDIFGYNSKHTLQRLLQSFEGDSVWVLIKEA